MTLFPEHCNCAHKFVWYVTETTRPRATQQGCVKCRHHVTVPAVLSQETIPEEGDKKLKKKQKQDFKKGRCYLRLIQFPFYIRTVSIINQIHYAFIHLCFNSTADGRKKHCRQSGLNAYNLFHLMLTLIDSHHVKNCLDKMLIELIHP